MEISWLDSLCCERNHESREDIVSKLIIHTCINQQLYFNYVQIGHTEKR